MASSVFLYPLGGRRRLHAEQGAPRVGFGSRQTLAGTLAESLTGLASESISTTVLACYMQWIPVGLQSAHSPWMSGC